MDEYEEMNKATTNTYAMAMAAAVNASWNPFGHATMRVLASAMVFAAMVCCGAQKHVMIKT